MNMKDLARRVLPECCHFGHWVPRYFDRLARLRTGDVVASGPFRGMRLTGRSFASVYAAELVGCYEREIHDCVEDFIAWQPELIVDVGAAEGYYAVGLARRCPSVRVIAFEAESEGRKMPAETVAANQVEQRTEIRGYCTKQDLRKAINSAQQRVGIVMDCEGGEMELLDPGEIPELRKCEILLETHEFKQPGAHATFRARFARTHQILEIEQSRRVADEYPFGNWLTPFLPKVYRMLAVFEHRPPINRWLFMLPIGAAVKTEPLLL